MYELNGKQYSLEHVTAAAELSNLSVEEYLSKHGMVKLNDPVEETANVGSENQAVNMDLNSEDFSLGSLDQNNFKPFDPKAHINKPTGFGTKDPLVLDNIKVEENIKKAKNKHDDRLINKKGFDYDDIAKKIHSDPEKYKGLLSATQDPKALLNRNKLLEELIPGFSEVSNPYLLKMIEHAGMGTMTEDEKLVLSGAKVHPMTQHVASSLSNTKHNFRDDDHNLYTEPYSRVKFDGAGAVHTLAGAVGEYVMGSKPYIFGEENLKEVGDGDRFVVTYGDDPNMIMQNHKYNTRSFNINKLRAIYDEIISSQEYVQDGEKAGGEEKHIENVIQKGIQFFSGDDKEFAELSRKVLDSGDPEAIQALKNNPTYQDYIDGNVKQLYEISGPNKGNIVSMDQATGEAKEVLEQAQELTESMETDELDAGLAKAFSNLKAIAKDAHLEIQNKGEGNFKNQTFKYPGQKYLSSILDFAGNDSNFHADLRNLKGIFEDDDIPTNITTISGTTPEANRFNNALKEYLAFNKAVTMNIDPMEKRTKKVLGMEFDVTRDTFMGGVVDNVGRRLSLNEGLESKQQAVQFFDAAIHKNTNLKYVDPKKANERLYEGFGNARYIGDGFVDLGMFAAEIYALRKVSGNAISKGLNKVDKALKGGILYSNRITRGATKFTLGAVDEAALFTGLTLLKGGDREEVKSSVLFGGALGGSNKFAAGLMKRLMTPGGFFSKATHNLMQYNSGAAVIEGTIGAASGSSVYHFAQFLTDNEEFQKLLEVDKDDPNYSDYYGQKLLESWSAEFVKMALLNGSKGITPKGFRNTYHSMREDMLRMKGRDARSEQAAESFNIDHNRIDNFASKDKRYKQNPLEKDINKAYQNKINEIESNQKNGKITEEQANEQINKARTDKIILENKLAIITSKKIIESESGKDGNGHYFKNEMEASTVGNKLLAGEKLTEHESRQFSNVNPAYVLNSMGSKGRKLAEGKEFRDHMQGQLKKHEQIQKFLNNSEYKTDFNAKEEREQAYEHLSKMWENASRQNELKFKGEKTEGEKEELKQLEEKYKDLNEGESYKKIQKTLEAYNNKRYQEDIASAREILKVTGQAKGLKQARTEREFQELYNSSGLKSRDVRGTLAFYNPNTQKMIINKNLALKTRTITTGKHEVLHHVLRDVLKDDKGKVTKEGIKIIDDVLDKLTPEQRKIVQERIDKNYRYDEKGKELAKEDYYEEHLTTLSESIANGEIKFSEKVGNSLLDFIPGMKKKGFENLEVGVGTGEQLFNLIKSYSKNETLGIEAAKAISKDAPTKGLKGKGKDSRSFKMELESDKKTGVAKLKAKIQENRDMGPGNQIMNRNIEQGFKEQIKRVENLKTQFTAAELRAKIKKAKGQKKEDLELALQEKFRGFEKEVELAKLNIETGEAKFSEKDFDGKISYEAIEKEGLKLDKTSDNAFIVAYNKNFAKETMRRLKNVKLDADFQKNKEAKQEIADEFILNDGRGLVGLLKKYDPAINKSVMGYLNSFVPGTGRSLFDVRLQEFYEKDPRYNRIIQSTTNENVQRKLERKENNDDIINKSFENKNLVDKVSNGTPSIVQRNLKVNGKAILDAGTQLRQKFVDKALDIAQKLKEEGIAPEHKDFRNRFGKEVFKDTKLFEEFKKEIGATKYDNFLGEIMDGILKNPKGLNLAFFVQSEKFYSKTGREPMFVRKEADNNKTSKYLKKGRGGYTTENPAAQNYSKATTKEMMELAIKDGKASYTENLANGVFVYERLSTRRRSNKEIKDYFKVPNTKEKLLETLYTQALTDAMIGNAKKPIFTKEQKDITARKFQKEFDVYFSKNSEGVKLREGGFGPKGFFADSKEQVNEHFQLIEGAPLEKLPFLFDLYSSGNLVTWGAKAVDLRSSGTKVVNLPKGSFFVIGKDLTGKRKTENQKMLEHGWTVDISGAKVGNKQINIFQQRILSKLGKDAPQSAAMKHGNSKPSIKTKETINNFVKRITKDHVKNEPLTKEAIREYINNVVELLKIEPRATWDLIYNQNASGGLNRQLAKATHYELGIKKGGGGNRFEHVLQNGEFNVMIKDIAEAKDAAAKKQMTEWLAKNYRQYILTKESEKIVDDKYILADGTVWEAKSKLHPAIRKAWDRVKNGEKEVKIPSADARLFNEYFGNKFINPYAIKNGNGISKAKEYGFDVPQKVWKNNINVQRNAANLIGDVIVGKITKAEALKRFNKTLPIAKPQAKMALKYSKGKTTDILEVIEKGEAGNKEAREVQSARFSKQDISKEFNGYLEKSTGIKKESVFGAATAMARGKRAKIDFGDYFIPVGAEDFAGLMHKTLAKGKAGEKQLEFYDKVLYEPYNKAVEGMTNEAMALKNDFKAIKKKLTAVPKTLKEYTEGGVFTKEQAVRVYMWNKLGYEIPGISKKVKSELLKEVDKNADLHTFANEIVKITKGDGYAKPKESWVAGNIAMDMVDLVNGAKRTKHLEVWQNNADQLFNKENLLKLEAAYGPKYVKTLKRTLERMKTGSNRKWGGNETIEKWNDWVNGSVGAIMFLNTRSAVLQTISNINYINFSDNNPLQAAKAFGNQKQYWKDFNTLFNSQYLQSRRGGNKINVNESELALAQEKGGVQGVIALMLNKGFVLTRMADSFAISTGGASMYRNRLNRYKKEGLSEKEAEKKAFRDFMKITEETQQSSRPDRISEQQAGNLGRFMLAFANTPMQYNRIIKRNLQDLIARRGDPKEKLTKITYYGMIQNLIFNALQKALFVSAFSDEEDDAQQQRNVNIGEGMLDSLLRGSGLIGNATVAVKNVAKAVITGANEPALQALSVSPPLHTKIKKLRGADYLRKKVTKENMFEPTLDNPALNAGAQFSSAVFNFPLDRAIRKAQNMEAAMGEEAEYWQKVALALGWGEWELGMQEEDKSKKKRKKKVKRYAAGTFK